MSGNVTRNVLKGFLEAFNKHDLDAILGYFADDCVFYMPRGAGPRGDQFKGKEQVRTGLAKRFEGIPDVHYGDDRHWVYRRAGLPCRVCGTHIVMEVAAARKLYWCPRCQPTFRSRAHR